MKVPNPLFDLGSIMCGQFGKPFWEFFLATLLGKAIIKTHIQVSPWHDTPLHLGDGVFNFIVEIPK
ncbi:hypothetical protein QJS10_CPB15g01285 [Acorus calamus]|uniref:Uncharacterized protein n=1 Tax=Acorus calamus TaxID=4465 RepID=A0AAV9D578_ACOCL|nr:hypothetical protein QJS10_CPB15g01285 [Acorus calamus]